jgi:DNA polymerase
MTATNEAGVSARDFLPARHSLAEAREAAAGCRGCDLWRNATQTVFGEGRRRASLMLVGEMPGDREDIAGRPFVGPAGQLLDKALTAAEIERGEVYVTNAVKHFKWEPRGRRRLHRTPTAAEVGACRPWLELEIELVKPRVLVCLGATAAHALLGRSFSVTRDRGRFVSSPLAPHVTATVHPSALLRLPPTEDRDAALQRFIEDLCVVKRALEGGAD